MEGKGVEWSDLSHFDMRVLQERNAVSSQNADSRNGRKSVGSASTADQVSTGVGALARMLFTIVKIRTF